MLFKNWKYVLEFVYQTTQFSTFASQMINLPLNQMI